MTIHHARKLGYCISGIRRMCEQHGLDFRKLVREGYTIEEISDLDDALIQRVIAVAKQEEADGR